MEQYRLEVFGNKSDRHNHLSKLKSSKTLLLKSNLKNSILKSLPDHSIKFPCYTVSMQSVSGHESNATTLFKVNKIMPRRSAVGIFTTEKFVSWIVGKVYSAKGAKQ